MQAVSTDSKDEAVPRDPDQPSVAEDASGKVCSEGGASPDDSDSSNAEARPARYFGTKVPRPPPGAPPHGAEDCNGGGMATAAGLAAGRAAIRSRVPRWMPRGRAASERYRASKHADPRIDSIVHSVASHYNVPICVVALEVDGGLQFKAQCGLDVEHMPLQERATEEKVFRLFHHSISRDLPVTINDAASDDRLTNDPLVANYPHVRFYTGAPLIYEKNVYVGTLCIIDSSPRCSFTLMEGEWLTEQAAEVVKILKEREESASD